MADIPLQPRSSVSPSFDGFTLGSVACFEFLSRRALSANVHFRYITDACKWIAVTPTKTEAQTVVIVKLVTGCSYGRGGIRTHGTLLTYTHFPGVRLKPLGHPSCRLFREEERTGRDSNSRYRVHRYAGFRDRCLQPLGHLSWSLRSYRAKWSSSTRHE